jgi:very-short-patch-repair endonuclease/DNA polymerase III delta prime subunit
MAAVTAPTDARVSRVRTASKRWRTDLINISGTNRTLFFKDLRVGTLSLDEALTGGLAELLSGKPTRLTRLFGEPEDLTAATASLKAIARKSREFAEELGLPVTYLAVGFATWAADADQDRLGKQPYNAPVLLRSTDVRARPGTVDGFELEVTGDVVVNPVLLHLLHAQHQIRIRPDELVDLEDDAARLDRIVKLCRETLPGFAIKHRHVLANLTYADQTLVEDLDDDNALVLAASDLIAALAGDQEAADRVRSAGAEVDPRAPDLRPPSDEFFVLDADGSQTYVINAVAAGQNLVVQGPPGTGKSQTIANVIAQLVGEGKRVLFVAQKRAAITAVVGRLEKVDLGHLTMDLFETSGSRQAVVRAIGEAMDERRQVPKPDVTAVHRRLATSRDLLVQTDAAVHELRAPWDLALLGDYADGTTTRLGLYDLALAHSASAGSLRLPVEPLLRWEPGTLSYVMEVVGDLAAEGGLAPTGESSGWREAAFPDLPSVNEALDAVAQLRTLAGERAAVLTQLCAALRLPVPQTREDEERLLVQLAAHESVLARGGTWLLDPAVTNEDIAARAWVLGAHAEVPDPGLGFFAKRKLAKDTEDRFPAGTPARQLLLDALELRRTWRGVALPPVPVAELRTLHAIDGQISHRRDVLLPRTVGVDLTEPATLDRLASDPRLRSLPRFNQLLGELHRHGLEALVDELRRRGETDPDTAAATLAGAFALTVIDHLERTDPRIASTTGWQLDRAAETFGRAEVESRSANAHRVRRSAADALTAALDTHPQQAELIRNQMKRKKGHRSLRQLLTEAPDLILAAKPVWAASPQMVSDRIPLEALFDVVLFDEASQVLPSAALPSIARGRQTVVAGDSLQLPPTTLFTRTIEAEVEDVDDDETGIVVTDMESILDAVESKLGTQRSRHLAWHYRSKDERLIATSNTWVYRPVGREMTTFPSANGERTLTHVAVAPSTGLGRTNKSPVDEVTEVIDLVMEHAKYSPDRSLGVIAFGIEHANRMLDELDRRMTSAGPELRAWFAPDRDEPFFIKNIERVQGDERDTIILAVGYTHTKSGGLSYNWGPVMGAGGDRRVNVAISRAKEAIVLVTSFRPEEVDETRSSAAGFHLLRRFVTFTATDGETFGDAGPSDVALNPFEHDILTRLRAAGLQVTPQYGVGSYRLDFAVHHPSEPGRFVLAVEADGASYHSGTIARERDRLRQQLLTDRGWTFVRIWSTDYFRDPETQIKRVVEAYEAALEGWTRTAVPEPEWEPTAATRGPRPEVAAGYKITEYTDQDLDAMVRWVTSDDLPHTRDEVFEMVKSELGFQKNGRVIVERIGAAVDRVTTRS